MADAGNPLLYGRDNGLHGGPNLSLPGVLVACVIAHQSEVQREQPEKPPGSSLPNLSCGQSSLAHVRAIILRKDVEKVPAYHLLVSRDYGEGVWEAVVHAGDEFNLCPFGLEAQRLLRM